MTPNTILWIYIVLLVLGGVMGLVKAGSKASLIASSIFAAVLALCALNIIAFAYSADIVLAILLVFFGMRFARGRKFMPAGMMCILTVVTLALRHLL